MKNKKVPAENNNHTEEGILKTKLSRRSFMKAGAASVAVVGVGGMALQNSKALSVSPMSQSSADLFAAIPITLNVNGRNITTIVEPRAMLVNVLRENLNLTGTKRPCNRMECGGCTVMVDNQAVYSCTIIASRVQAPAHSILTVEGTDPVLQALQAAWVPNDASQCGYCQPGRLMAATALLKSNPTPTPAQIKAGIDGNLCRCGTYINVLQAVQDAAKAL